MPKRMQCICENVPGVSHFAVAAISAVCSTKVAQAHDRGSLRPSFLLSSAQYSAGDVVGAEDLPETQDILGSIPAGSVYNTRRVSQRSVFEPDAAAACNHQQQITSALCVLVNMVEHSAAAGACIAKLGLTADRGGPGPQSCAADSPSTNAEDQALSERERPASPMTSSQQSLDSNGRTRLATGSRRRRRNGARFVMEDAEVVIEDAAVQPKALRLGSQQVPATDDIAMKPGLLSIICTTSL